MSRKKRRDITVFSLSFLDCISCGFGAIILLFVISLGSERIVLVQIRDTLIKVFQQRLAELEVFKSQSEELKIEIKAIEDAVSDKKETISAMEVDLDVIFNRLAEADYGLEALVTDIDEKNIEIDARQNFIEIEQRESPSPIGVPVESNHIIFVMDTSGSMRNPSTAQIWPIVIRKIAETLEVYPIVEGIQFLDADGNYIIRGSRGQWLPDNRETRTQFLRLIQNYGHHSESNPVPGVVRAIKTFSNPDKVEMKMGVYVFGDEFVETADKVLARLDKINPVDEEGNRSVRINAIGFPHVVKFERHYTHTGLKFANLMRELTYQHGGAFVGIEN